MIYEAKKFDHLLGLEGFSDELLKNHFTLYEGYVTNTNKAVDAIVNLLDHDKTGTPEYAEVMRRFGWEFNGMRLHELYFENMMKGGSTLEAESELGKKIIKEFGSLERWEKHFRATGAMRGIGWVVLYQDDVTGTMYNVWINEHNEGHLTGATPLLVMDVFEHAYMIQYGLKKVDYIEVFMKNICWHVVSARFAQANA
ncbi:MAG TPA: superoxide dismutase [Candidatus Moranbacteria bacterium]|nr:superoxide dismutase [Candidatus Moranbacteria bacterium]HBI51073.1 superoxide dismutase [Candidatus Moranbacteria bacterium]HBU10692.1 superoxide dismutase [Candidatus Moranbacteria bacterium]HCO99335.1 superoxide dismutase [Candidatus Moranbacteria bacterium]